MLPFELISPVKNYLWGGNKLKSIFGKGDGSEEIISESWELSCRADGMCTVKDGCFAGETLENVLRKNPSVGGTACKRFREFPILVKLIDACDRLSVQVHPDDAYARLNENCSGKTEMWHIIDCKPDSEIICGFRQNTDRQTVEKAIENGTLCELLNRIKVNPGDTFFIPAGTVHALGDGILTAEIQQNSDITYRLFDYNRIDSDGNSRPLHVQKALDVLSFSPYRNTRPRKPIVYDNQCVKLLSQCQYFSVRRHDIFSFADFFSGEYSFTHILVTEGDGVLTVQSPDNSAVHSSPLKCGASIFVPAGTGSYKITGECSLIVTEI